MTLSPEIDLMLDKARRYIDAAESLRQQRHFDSAASRLYYAMFYCASALLRARGLTFSSHKGVLSAFARHFTGPKLLPQEFHKWLREAFSARQISDYQYVVPIDDGDVLRMEAEAKQFLSSAEALLKQEAGARESAPSVDTSQPPVVD
ncbi:MAG: HEPN domain-containing protein [Chloroflexi bacterium]|nr:HEPN domain-containing protein [Chloroflexota bacterium]